MWIFWWGFKRIVIIQDLMINLMWKGIGLPFTKDLFVFIRGHCRLIRAIRVLFVIRVYSRPLVLNSR